MLWFFCGVVFLFLILPIFIVIPISFSSASYLQFPPPGLSFKWYLHFFTSRDWIEATILSLEVALIVTVVSVLLGTLLALALVRGNFKGKRIIYPFAISPMIIPLIITAIGVYFFYSWLHIVGTIYGLVAAHTVLAIPYVLVVVSSGLRGLDQTLERAALNLGANPVRTFFLITLPIIKPSVLSAALLAFIVSFDELVIAIFISGTSAVTLPKRMWDGIRLEIDPTIAAVSTLLIVVSTLFLLSLNLVGRRK
jgi:ABC-type spermidine/putrescine transport system permease subunit II